VTVASALPRALAVGKVDAREDAAVEAVGVALVNDEVVEVRLETREVQRSSTVHPPEAVCDRQAARAESRRHREA
jgi:hypothetical protein